MSSKAVFVNDFKKLAGPTKSELKTVHNKLISNSHINKITKSRKNITKNQSLSSINLRCHYTGRKKGLVRKTKMTRMYFKLTAFKGLVVGLRKSSW